MLSGSKLTKELKRMKKEEVSKYKPMAWMEIENTHLVVHNKNNVDTETFEDYMHSVVCNEDKIKRALVLSFGGGFDAKQKAVFAKKIMHKVGIKLAFVGISEGAGASAARIIANIASRVYVPLDIKFFPMTKLSEAFDHIEVPRVHVMVMRSKIRFLAGKVGEGLDF
jgi:hypothetical protein